ncbi:MAG: VTT domain-containing protein [Chloroflexi bacterium]|nr:VTT domain-containing protein [Chloroflexota bacterium]
MRLGALTSVAGLRRLWSRHDRRVQLVVLLAAVGMIAAVWSLRGYIANIETVGYPGVFLLSLLGSVSMVLPVPGLISVCGASVLLSPFVIGILAGLGETIGEVSGYAVGYGGGSVVERHRAYAKVKGWMERRGTLVIFAVSVIPNPVFDVVGIAAGAVRFPLHRFLGVVLVGKMLKGIMVAYTCHYGITLLPWVD